MILLYHGIVEANAPVERWCIGQAIPQDKFERQLRWLRGFGTVLPLAEYLDAVFKRERRHERLFALTFDDGMRCTFRYAVPVLKELGLPATFFVATAHLGDEGGPLWFSYLNALCFESDYADVQCDGLRCTLRSLEERKEARRQFGKLARTSGDPDGFCRAVAEVYPLSPELAGEYAGMTLPELQQLSADILFEIGGHTVSHPYLSRLKAEDQAREIGGGKEQLCQWTGRKIRYFAYPGGDYDGTTVGLVKAAGYSAAFATKPLGLGANDGYEIGRVGIYSGALWKTRLKAFGIAGWFERLGIAIG